MKELKPATLRAKRRKAEQEAKEAAWRVAQEEENERMKQVVEAAKSTRIGLFNKPVDPT